MPATDFAVCTQTCVLFLCVFLVPSLILFSQTAPPPPLPSDPVALMSLARENNGLDSLDLHPWHIRGTYTISDLQGDSQTGTYEEWWASPARYKRTYSGATSTYTFYTTGSSLYRLGPQDWPIDKELNLIESWKESPEETLTIPTEAVLVELSAPIRVGKAFTTHAVLPLKQLGGSYPAEAINKQIQGPVAVEATIRADGYVSEVRAISGPMQLHQGPIDSVNHWYFKPYRVIGQPVELQIEVPWRYENLAIPW